MKVDDDVFLGLDNILAWYNRAHRHRYLDHRGQVSRLYLGQVNSPDGQSNIGRDTKTKRHLPATQYSHHVFPPYTTGPAYMVSRDAAAELGRWSEWARRHPFRLEDVFVAIALERIHIFPQRFHESMRFIEPMSEMKPGRGGIFAVHVHEIGRHIQSFPLLFTSNK